MFKQKKILIPSCSYINGHANISEHNFGCGLIIDGGNKMSDLSWSFDCIIPGTYFLLSSYATNEIRHVDLYVNDVLIKNNALQNITGGFNDIDIKEYLECECLLQKGKNYLRIKTDSFIPHIKEFKFILKKKNNQNPLKDSLFEKIEKYILINPYKTKYPSHIRKFFNSLITIGFKQTLKKTFIYLSPINYYKKNYSDILGVYTKKLAFKGPKLVQIDITNQCNNNCIGCWCNSPLLEEKEMPLIQKNKFIPYDKMIFLLYELKNISVSEIYFSGGGEPFMHPQIMEILKKAKELNFVVYINTNFTLLNRKIIDELVEIGIDHMTISIWAGNDDIYVKTHPNKTKNDFYKIKNNLIYLNSIKERKPYTKIYNVISNINFHNIFSMFDFALSTLSDSIEFTLIDIIPSKTDKLLLSKEELINLKSNALKLLEKWQSNSKLKEKIILFGYNDFLRRIDSSINSGKGIYDENIIKNIPCTIGWTFARINADGDVNGCLKSHKIPTGNIFKQSFTEIWTSKEHENFRIHTLLMKENDEYFKNIGNDENICQGCLKVCDDIGRNIEFKKKIDSISLISKITLKIIAYLYIKKVLKPPIYQKISLNKNFKENNQFYKGFKSGDYAFTGPKEVVIDVTNKCNKNCIFCFTHSFLIKETKPKNEWFLNHINKNTLINLINSLKELKTERIRFTGGGDPLFYPYLKEAVIAAKQAKLYTSITTSLPKNSIIDIFTLINEGIDDLSISLMSPTPENYLKTYPNSQSNDFFEIVNTIKKIRENYNIKITLCYVISKLNYDYILTMAELADDLNVNSLYFTLLDDSIPELKQLSLNEDNLKALLMSIKSIEAKKNNSKLIVENLMFLKKLIESKLSNNNLSNFLPCSIAWHFTRILASGDVIPCCKAVNHKLGNINETNFEKIWNNEKYKDFRLKLINMNNNKNNLLASFCKTSCDNFMHNYNFYRENIEIDL